MKRPRLPYRSELSPGVIIGCLDDDPDPLEPKCEPIRLLYSKAASASQSASRKGRGSRRSSASKASKRKRSAGESRVSSPTTWPQNRPGASTEAKRSAGRRWEARADHE
jgi:hypothetical protein